MVHEAMGMQRNPPFGQQLVEGGARMGHQHKRIISPLLGTIPISDHHLMHEGPMHAASNTDAR